MPIVRGTLAFGFSQWLKDLKVGDQAQGRVESYLEKSEKELADILGALYEHAGVTSALPDVLNPRSANYLLTKHQAGAMAAAQVAGQVVGGAAGAALNPINAAIGQEAHYLVRSTLLSQGEALRYWLLHPDKEEEARYYLATLGYDDVLMDLLKDINQQLLDPQSILALWRRHKLSEVQSHTLLTQLGYQGETIALIRELTNVIPNVQDLITLGVRDAFNDDAAERFSYDEDRPDNLAPFLDAQGLSEDWWKRYWRAHWQLPSPAQVFEMFQRLRPDKPGPTVTDKDLDLYLKIADYPKYWRDRFKEIQYATLTRVDIRRLYELGQLNYDGLVARHQDIGYSPEDATLLADFVVKDRAAALIDISKPKIVTAFKDSLISEENATKMLLDIGIDPQGVQFEMAIARFDKANKEVQDKIDLIKLRYVDGTIDQGAMFSALAALGLPATRSALLYQEFLDARAKSVKRPSKNDVDEWWNEYIISDADYIQLLSELNYQTLAIGRYLISLKTKRAKQAAKDLAAALADHTAAQREAAATSYQKQAAALDLQIAQDKVGIANIAVAAAFTEDAALQANYAKSELQLKAHIAGLEQQKAALKVGSIV
jgi:hypothetical protein